MLIAVDAAGGDYAPHEVLKGALAAADEYKIEVALVGKRTFLQKLIKTHGTRPEITFVEASQTITCDESPVQAIRDKPDSSIVIGTKLVSDGTAHAFVSAGSTGAVVASSYFFLGKSEGIQRPALCSVIPDNIITQVLLIDVGANADCRPEFLVQFAQIGALFATSALGIESPRVAVLNNNEMRLEVNSMVQETCELLEGTNLNFVGYVGAQDIMRGKADIIVTDGFTGNIVIKTMEGLGDTIMNLMNVEQASLIDHSLTGEALVQYTNLFSIGKQIDYKEYGGACLLGVNGNIVVAHGRSQAKAIKNAIHLAYRAVKTDVVEVIRDGMGTFQCG
jgi:glycerol-3-phosphate acyltransferase PlsX